MDDLYTRSGRLLQRSGHDLHSRSGFYLGRLQGGKVFDPDGRYCGTLVGDRIVYRTVDSAARGTVTTAPPCPPGTGPNRNGCALWGIEPPFGD